MKLLLIIIIVFCALDAYRLLTAACYVQPHELYPIHEGYEAYLQPDA